MKILMATSEAYPFIKTGGLGDVAFALPKSLNGIGEDVRVILPKYRTISSEYQEKMKKICDFNVMVGWRKQYCGLWSCEYKNVIYYFLDNEYYFKREVSYGYYDDGERFAFFSRAIIEAIPHIPQFIPDIIHCNDWHCGMVPVLLKTQYLSNNFYSNIKTVFTIHNLKYQGIFPSSNLGELFSLDEGYASEDELGYYQCISYMKGGINYSDKITTVSKTYAEEIKTEHFGETLHGLLKEKEYKLTGILNGIDYEINDPESDTLIYKNYNSDNIEIKQENKLEFQKKLGLPQNENIPMISMVSRLVKQKGIDLVMCIFEELLKENVQVVIIGTGEKCYEDYFKRYEYNFRDKVSANIYFDNSLAQNAYASSDMFLMPSLFEPCGIGQLIALRYGSLPIVRETGGLKDTIVPYNEYDGTGFGFTFTNYNAHDMLFTIRKALKFYKDNSIWKVIVKKAMEQDYSWNKSAEIYKKLYYSLNEK